MLGLIKCVLLDVSLICFVTRLVGGRVCNIMVVVCSVAVSESMENVDQLAEQHPHCVVACHIHFLTVVRDQLHSVQPE